MKKCFLIVCILLWASAVQAATRWLDPAAGGGSGCAGNYTPATHACTGGTTDNAYITLTAALNAMASGDTLNIRAGTYTADINGSNFPTSKSGTGSGNSYTGATIIQAYTPSGGSKETVILGNGSSGANGACVGFGTPSSGQTYQYVIFKDFICDGRSVGWNAGGVGGGGNGGSVHHIKFDGIEFRNWLLTPLFLGGDDNAAHDLWAVNNYIHDNGSPNGIDNGQGSLAYGHCFYDESANALVENNRCINQAAYGIQIYPNNNQTGVIIRNNWFENTGMGDSRTAFAIGAIYGPGAQIYNNVLVNNQNGLELHGNVLAYNNTIFGSGIGHGGSCCYDAITLADGTGARIQNNLVIGNAINSISTGSASGFTIDHNVTTGTASNIFVDPRSGGDFHLKSTTESLASTIDHGTPLGSPYNVDYASVARPQGSAWDIGAYEFVQTGSLPVVTITSPTSSATYLTSSTTVTLSGTSTQSGGSVTWSCDRCGSGSTTGSVASWTTTTITLKAGLNIVTVTGTDASLNSSTDTLTITYAPTFAGNSLVMALGFENGSGTSATDSSGNGNNGSLINGTAWTTSGRYGKALSFDGVNQYVEVLDANSLHLTQSFTISVWAKIASAHTDFLAILHKNSLPTNSTYELYGSTFGYCGTGGISGFSDANGTSGPYYSVCDATPLQVGVWTHLAVTYDGAALKLYKNGVLLTTTSATGYLEPSTLTLQIGGSEFGENFDGALDEVRLYNYALPPTAGGNTSFGATCVAADELSSPSIVGDANCPIVPLSPPIKLEIGAGSTLSIGAGSTFAIGAAQ